MSLVESNAFSFHRAKKVFAKRHLISLLEIQENVIKFQNEIIFVSANLEYCDEERCIYIYIYIVLHNDFNLLKGSNTQNCCKVKKYFLQSKTNANITILLATS